MTGLLLLGPTSAFAMNWGTFEADSCTSTDYRQYSAILWNIPWGQSWEQACANMPATINGYYFSHPSRCVNAGGHMWGEFDVPDSSCPHWSTFYDHDCYSNGLRSYFAILYDVPWGYSWEDACWNESAIINGYYFSTPSWCLNNGFNELGYFRVPDPTCACHSYTSKIMCNGECTTVTRNSCSVFDSVPVGCDVWEECQ
jgi:hypothetical protein